MPITDPNSLESMAQVLLQQKPAPPTNNNYYTGPKGAPLPLLPNGLNPATFGIDENTLRAVQQGLWGQQLQDNYQRMMESIPTS